MSTYEKHNFIILLLVTDSESKPSATYAQRWGRKTKTKRKTTTFTNFMFLVPCILIILY